MKVGYSVDKQDAITSQKDAQAILKSPDMLAFDVVPYLKSLSEQSGEDLNDLMRIASSMLSFMSGERHLLFRRVIAQPMSKRSVSGYQHRIAKVSQVVVASFLKEPAPDLVLHLANPLYLHLVREVFGVTIKDEDSFLDQVSRATLITEPLRSIKDLKRLQAELVSLEDLVMRQLKDKTASGLARDIYENAFGNLTENEIVILLLALIVASRTTMETLTCIVCEYGKLTDHARERMVSREWLMSNVEHLVRFCASTQYLTRVARQAKNLSDKPVLAGDRVVVDVPRANRDVSFYQEFIDFSCLETLESPVRCPHVAFGGGVHKCPGADLAKLIIIEVLPEFFEHIEGLKCEQDKIHFSTSTFAKRMESCPVSVRQLKRRC